MCIFFFAGVFITMSISIYGCQHSLHFFAQGCPTFLCVFFSLLVCLLPCQSPFMAANIHCIFLLRAVPRFYVYFFLCWYVYYHVNLHLWLPTFIAFFCSGLFVCGERSPPRFARFFAAFLLRTALCHFPASHGSLPLSCFARLFAAF